MKIKGKKLKVSLVSCLNELDKTCYYYSAAIYCIYIILISYTAFNWTCVMENGDLDITFHMESFFLACSIYCFAHMETSP
ncbi:Uncharacterised protein [Streptococcus pneumoniae]|nr:Uncharacterised protein [Streptococcus pneumoniae]